MKPTTDSWLMVDSNRNLTCQVCGVETKHRWFRVVNETTVRVRACCETHADTTLKEM